MQTRKFKSGAYATIISAMMIIVVIIVNLIFTKLNLNFDMTLEGKYSLTEETVEMLGELEDDITFYYLASSADSIDLFDKILAQYTKYGENITLVYKDPLLNPKFASQYTTATPQEYSIIVVNETNGRSKYIPYTSMLVEEYSMDPSTYEYVTEVTGIDMEGQLNSAIGYVTTEHLPTLYEVSGHGMQTLGTEAIALLEKANIVVNSGENSLDLLSTTKIPEDCDVLLIYTPQTDFTESEVAVLSNYMQNGGNLIFVLSYLNVEHPNLLQLVEQYGIELQDGLLLEENTRNYMQVPYILLPNVVAHELTSGITSRKYIVGQASSALSIKEGMEMDLSVLATVTGFLETSNSAYIKDVNVSSYTKEEGDPTGKYYVGIYVEDYETKAEMAVFSSAYIFNDAYASTSTFGNLNLLVNCVNVLSDAEDTTAAVRTVSLQDDNYLVLTEAQINIIGLCTVAILPLAILITGIVVVIYRRKHS